MNFEPYGMLDNFLDDNLTSFISKLQPSIKHNTALICIKIHTVINQKYNEKYYKSKLQTG